MNCFMKSWISATTQDTLYISNKDQKNKNSGFRLRIFSNCKLFIKILCIILWACEASGEYFLYTSKFSQVYLCVLKCMVIFAWESVCMHVYVYDCLSVCLLSISVVVSLSVFVCILGSGCVKRHMCISQIFFLFKSF